MSNFTAKNEARKGPKNTQTREARTERRLFVLPGTAKITPGAFGRATKAEFERMAVGTQAEGKVLG